MLPVILLNVARYLTTSLRGPAQPYTNEARSAEFQKWAPNLVTAIWLKILKNLSFKFENLRLIYGIENN